MAITDSMSAFGRSYKKKVYVMVFSEKADPDEAVKQITELFQSNPEFRDRFEAVVKVVDIKTNTKERGADVLI